MTQGVFVGGMRAPSKKALREAINSNPSNVRIEATAIFPGAEYGGPITSMPEGKMITLVGPCPSTNRKWYANLTRKGDKFVLK